MGQRPASLVLRLLAENADRSHTGLPSSSGLGVTTPSVTAAPDGPGEQRQGTHAACAATLSAEAGRIPPATTWTPSPNAVYTTWLPAHPTARSYLQKNLGDYSVTEPYERRPVLEIGQTYIVRIISQTPVLLPAPSM